LQGPSNTPQEYGVYGRSRNTLGALGHGWRANTLVLHAASARSGAAIKAKAINAPIARSSRFI
jgi:hypothetical protein